MFTRHLLWVTVSAALVSAANAALRVAPDPSPTPVRIVPITEETAAPGVTDYELCDNVDTTEYINAITNEFNECAVKTTYVWQSALPTDAERRELCSCTLLIDKLQTVVVPRCSITRGGRAMSTAQLLTYAFALCEVEAEPVTTKPVTTKPVTTAPTRPPSTTTYSPSTTTDNQNNVGTSTKSSKSKLPLIGGIGGAVVVVIIAVVAFLCCRKRKDATEAKQDTVQVAHGMVEATPLSPLGSEDSPVYSAAPKTPPTKPRTSEIAKSGGSTTDSTQVSTLSVGTRTTSETGAWDDPAVTAMRIPYDSVFFGSLINRGGYGEVYRGTYKGEQVAIKQLLPERRKDLVQIDAFIREIKLLSTLDHERIVRCIGIAWNALSDVCAVVEYMPNGDLRTMLTKWEYQDARPRGFDADKAKIALHVAHALTYLHSCQPVIVHRDLKSRNIVLSENYDAKLTDFGESRERADTTMTAGVGTSLWMAPEVMLGERYNEKADVFSFGVVLAELATHELPYSHALDSMTGRKVIDSAILQRVSLGRLTIEFTEGTNEDIVQLGKECVALDPTQRPTSGEVLHRVHQVWRKLSS